MTKQTQEELLKLLDLGIGEVEQEDELLVDFDFKFGAEDDEVELTETVLKQDEWDKTQGTVLSQKHSLDCDAVTDFYCMFYHMQPEVAGQCISKRRQQFVETMMESPEYQAIHQSTQQNLLASELATIRVAREFADLQKKDEQLPESKQQENPDGNLFGAVAKALAGAAEEVEEADEMQKALGQAEGMGQGEAAQSANLDKIRATFQRLRSSRRLKDIFERAGAYRRAARAVQQNKTRHGYDDMIGFELSGDVARLLPSELALLDDDDLELDLLRRIVEHQAMSSAYEGIENQNKGPVVVVVDESGSMSGAPIANAKALALSMAWIAKHQKRWCALVGFSGGTEGVRCVLKPGKWDQTELLNWLDHFWGGGTEYHVPFNRLPNEYWKEMGAPKGKTDMIVISDGIIRIPSDITNQFLDWKTRESVRVISIVLGAGAGGLEKVSNEIHCLPALTVDCEAALSCMSI